MKLGIYGSGGLGREVLELAEIINSNDNRWDEIIFIDDFRKEKKFKEISVFPFENLKTIYTPDELEIVVAVGTPDDRKKLLDNIIENGYGLATLIHPNVHIPKSTKIGDGVVICVQAIISCDVVIKNNVYIQPNALIGHDCIIGDNSVISGFVHMAGHCHVGQNTYIGMSTTVKENISIGNNTIIGMTSSVMRDIPDNMIAMGFPARPLKKNEDGMVFKK